MSHEDKYNDIKKKDSDDTNSTLKVQDYQNETIDNENEEKEKTKRISSSSYDRNKRSQSPIRRRSRDRSRDRSRRSRSRDVGRSRDRRNDRRDRRYRSSSRSRSPSRRKPQLKVVQSNRVWDGFQWVERNPLTSNDVKRDVIENNDAAASVIIAKSIGTKDRRVYVGNLPPGCNTDMIKDFCKLSISLVDIILFIYEYE